MNIYVYVMLKLQMYSVGTFSDNFINIPKSEITWRKL